jgi:opacity protein-like surface antigen
MKTGLLFVLFVVVASASPAAAQSFDLLSRFSVGGSFAISQPKGEFAENVGNGYGAQGGVMFHLVRSGLVSLRFDVSGVVYDREEKVVPASTSRILFEVTTTNSIVALTWGPEVAVPTGRIRPYANVGYSRLLFRTSSSLKGTGSSDPQITNTTNYKDSTNAWVYSGGVRIPLGNIESPLTLDLGLRYHRGGEASYLREGSIRDNPDGSITITPLTSHTPFVLYTMGVQFRIPR